MRADVNLSGSGRIAPIVDICQVRATVFKVAIMDMKKILLLGGVGLTSAAVGIVLPTMMSGGHESSAKKDATAHDAGHGHEKDAGGHEAAPEAPKKADDHGGGHGGDHGGHGKEAQESHQGRPRFPAVRRNRGQLKRE